VEDIFLRALSYFTYFFLFCGTDHIASNTFLNNNLTVFWRFRVEISARKTAILTERFRGFPQFFQSNAGIEP
jgi:hypothetical protein